MNLNETVEAETGINDIPDEVSSGLSSLSKYSATEPASSNAQGTDGEGEMLQLGRKQKEQFSETLVGYKNKKLKKKIPADAH